MNPRWLSFRPVKWISFTALQTILPERPDVGRAISAEDEQKLLAAIAASRSPALLPLFILAIDTGLRASELRSLTWSKFL